jgi:hypothetical protein
VKVAFNQSGTAVPGSEPVVTTDAKGIWEAKYEPPVQAGPWTVQASFAGDPGRKPSTSAPCNTTY